ncbi:MAG: Uma2 family endonuclease [Leptolyngbya sp. SIO1E4]|nr:Uma2 family endonuclease [Leptolyngbya sp. SIO1E4]
MVIAALTPDPPHPVGEKRVVFHQLDWRAYQQILHALGAHRSARLNYLHGTLEITMPLEDHEFLSELIGRFIYFLVSELGQKIKTMGSTTLDREDLDRGAEPDKAYYIQNQAQVAGRTVDLQHDPPPDLVVEVDITHSDIDKLKLYAVMGVPEFWRYDGKAWKIYMLSGDLYVDVEASPTFSFVPKSKLYEFLEQAQTDEIEAENSLRQWLRKVAFNPSDSG